MKSKTADKFQSVWNYVQIARPDHWFKNVFMLPGFALAAFYSPEPFQWASVPTIILAIVAACIVASSNYTINEILDAPSDRLHPSKWSRPAAMGKINFAAGVAQWLILGILGIALGLGLNPPFTMTLCVFWLMAGIYNIRPLRCKDIPYLDVLCESVNNPIRLALGWYALVPEVFPPVSLLLAFWMVGAFFMTAKRYAEYRSIGDHYKAGQYRKSLAHYNENRLLVAMFFYTAASAFCGGVFIVRYKLELVLSIPLLAGCFGYYLTLSFRDDSPVQRPEQLYLEKNFVSYLAVTALIMVGLVFVEIPAMYQLFNVVPPSFEPLWRIGD